MIEVALPFHGMGWGGEDWVVLCGFGKMGSLYGEKKNHYLTLYTKVDSRRNDDLNVKNKTMASTKETG